MFDNTELLHRVSSLKYHHKHLYTVTQITNTQAERFPNELHLFVNLLYWIHMAGYAVSDAITTHRMHMSYMSYMVNSVTTKQKVT